MISECEVAASDAPGAATAYNPICVDEADSVPCPAPTGGSAMHHGVSIFDTLAAGTAMLLHRCDDLVAGLFPRPAALILEQELQRGHRHGAGLLDAAPGGIVRYTRSHV